MVTISHHNNVGGNKVSECENKLGNIGNNKFNDACIPHCLKFVCYKFNTRELILILSLSIRTTKPHDISSLCTHHNCSHHNIRYIIFKNFLITLTHTIQENNGNQVTYTTTLIRTVLHAELSRMLR